jgi:DNA-binding IclR family transcriptional regulator
MPRTTIQSIDRAVAVLHALASGSPQGLRLRDLAAALDLAPQTLQSLLRTLQQHHLVHQSQRGGPYTLGPALWDLGRAWLALHDPADRIGQELTSLVEEIGEYVMLAEQQAGQVRILADAQPDQALLVTPHHTRADALHTMATVKVLLACADKADREAVLRQMTFAQAGPNAAGSLSAYRKGLREVRQAGQAECIDEAGVGIIALAVPVEDSQGRVRAALGVSLPAARYNASRKQELLASMHHTAERLTELHAN